VHRRVVLTGPFDWTFAALPRAIEGQRKMRNTPNLPMDGYPRVFSTPAGTLLALFGGAARASVGMDGQAQLPTNRSEHRLVSSISGRAPIGACRASGAWLAVCRVCSPWRARPLLETAGGHGGAAPPPRLMEEISRLGCFFVLILLATSALILQPVIAYAQSAGLD
jgi:hypothetical protein